MQAKIPKNYAQILLQLEANLQQQCSIQKIRQLNDHYRPRKAIHLQRKMTALLSDPDNLRILQKNSKCEKQQKKKSPIKNKNQLNQRKINEQVQKFHNVADTCIKSLLQNSDKAIDKIKNLQKLDISKQQQGLKQRIMLKKVRSTQKLKRVLQEKNLIINDNN